jgi:hypothetical protein
MVDVPERQSNFPLWVVQGVVEVIFRGLVEDGTIEIGNRSIAEILEDYKRMADEIIDDGGEALRGVVDYRKSLLERARAEAEEAHDEMAVTLYAMWIEHFINGMLTRAFERKDYEMKVVMPLLRELRLQTKASALWAIAGLPVIDKESMRLIDQIIQFRNAFVHYKWLTYDDLVFHARDGQLRAIVEQSDGLISTLLAIESATFWNGRDNEIIECLREDVARRWQKGESLNVDLPPADPGV